MASVNFSPIGHPGEVRVQLKDGSLVSEHVYAKTTFLMKIIKENNNLLFQNLVAKCRDSNYQIPSHLPWSTKNLEATSNRVNEVIKEHSPPEIDPIFSLQKFGIMDSQGKIDDMTVKVILNSVEGEELRLIDPLKQST